jgi:hypothetical protein
MTSAGLGNLTVSMAANRSPCTFTAAVLCWEITERKVAATMPSRKELGLATASAGAEALQQFKVSNDTS